MPNSATLLRALSMTLAVTPLLAQEVTAPTTLPAADEAPSSRPHDGSPPTDAPAPAGQASLLPAPATPQCACPAQGHHAGLVRGDRRRARLQRVLPTLAATASAVGAGALVTGSGAALLAVVLLPVATAWAQPAGGVDGALMFANFAPAAMAAVGAAYLPVVLLAAMGADAFAFTLVDGQLNGSALRSGLAAALAMMPALVLAMLSAWSVLTLLGTMATLGASSQGRRLPGDPDNVTYLALALTAVVTGLAAVVAWGVGDLARPVVARRLRGKA